MNVISRVTSKKSDSDSELEVKLYVVLPVGLVR